MPTVVYLHGFLSSSASKKARVTDSWFAKNQPSWRFLCPDLPSSPYLTKQALDELFKDDELQQDVFLIGSSLGGFWATYIAEQKSFPTVLINPAVSPQERFQPMLGQPLKHYHTGEEVRLQERDFEALKACDTKLIHRHDNFWLLAQEGDEVLDYQLAVSRYQGCRQSIESGGSHEFDGYEAWLPEILQFFLESSFTAEPAIP